MANRNDICRNDSYDDRVTEFGQSVKYLKYFYVTGNRLSRFG